MYYSVFESTIRYLGGLISAYELSGKQHQFLIQKAQQLADRLSLGWSQVREYNMLSEAGPSDSEVFQGNTVPFGNVNFTANAPVKETVCPRSANLFQQCNLMSVLRAVEHCRGRNRKP